MPKKSEIDGVPFRNMLEYHQRRFARSAFASLNECLDYTKISFPFGPSNDPIALTHPGRDVHDAELRLSPGAVGFAVTHGLHKRYTIDFSDVRQVPAPTTFEELRALITLWTDCVGNSTKATQLAEMEAIDFKTFYPAIAAATRYASDWKRLFVSFSEDPGYPTISIWQPNGGWLRFKGCAPAKTYKDNGYLSKELDSSLLKPSPYITLYRSSWSPKRFIDIKLGPWSPVEFGNTLDPVQTLRAIKDAHQNGWELIEGAS